MRFTLAAAVTPRVFPMVRFVRDQVLASIGDEDELEPKLLEQHNDHAHSVALCFH